MPQEHRPQTVKNGKQILGCKVIQFLMDYKLEQNYLKHLASRMEGVLCSCTSALAMKFGSNSKRKRSERKCEQECVHQTWKPRHGAPSIKWEMIYEMENIFAIVMSNKGSYPKYIKRHTIQKQWSMQGISLRNGGNFGFVWGLTNTSEMKRNKTPVRQGKI